MAGRLPAADRRRAELPPGERRRCAGLSCRCRRMAAPDGRHRRRACQERHRGTAADDALGPGLPLQRTLSVGHGDRMRRHSAGAADEILELSRLWRGQQHIYPAACGHRADGRLRAHPLRLGQYARQSELLCHHRPNQGRGHAYVSLRREPQYGLRHRSLGRQLGAGTGRI